jgi:uncharacterized protein (DUF433 family)
VDQTGVQPGKGTAWNQAGTADHAGDLPASLQRQKGQTKSVTSDQLALISGDPQVMHGQPLIAGTRVPVSVILDNLAAEELTAEYSSVSLAGVGAAAAYGAALAREVLLPMP